MYDRRRQREPASAITSTANEQVQFVKTLYRANVRRKERLFVVEGVRLLEDALQAGARPELVLVAPDQLERTPRGTALHERLAEFRTLIVTEAVLKSISDTVTPQGVIAIFPLPAPATVAVGPVVLVLDGLRDPGNAGTILRSADASGMVRTVAFVNSVDAYAPKVVRAGMGAHFRLTILDGVEWSWLRSRLGDRPTYLATATGGDQYDQVDWTRDCALILGGEAMGAGDEAETTATRHVTIPMSGPTESLNAAMAGTVLLFEAARERRASARPDTRTSREAGVAKSESAKRPPVEQTAARPAFRRGPPPRRDAPSDRPTRSPEGPPAGKPGPGRRQSGSWKGRGPTPPAKAPPNESRSSDSNAPKPPHQSFGRTRRRPKL